MFSSICFLHKLFGGVVSLIKKKIKFKLFFFEILFENFSFFHSQNTTMANSVNVS